MVEKFIVQEFMAEKSLIKKYGIKLWVTSVKQPNKHPRAKFNFTLLRSNLSSSSESIVSSTVKYTDIFYSLVLQHIFTLHLE